MHLASVGRGQRRGKPTALLSAERDGDVHLGDQPLAPLRGQPRVVLQARIQATSERVDRRLSDEQQGFRRYLSGYQLLDQPALALGRGERVSQRIPQVKLPSDNPPEPEQVVLQVVKPTRVLGGGRDGLDGQLLDRGDEVTG